MIGFLLGVLVTATIATALQIRHWENDIRYAREYRKRVLG